MVAPAPIESNQHVGGLTLCAVRGTISPITQFMALSRCAHYGGWDAMELVEGGGETSMELV